MVRLMPRPGTQVIPAGWSEHHRPVAENVQTDGCQLLRPSSAATFDESSGKSVYPGPALLWSGPIRIQRLPRRGGAGDQTGDRSVTVQLYQCSIPIAAPEVQINDQIKLTAAYQDPTMAGKTLQVTEVFLGSQLWERDMFAIEVTPTTR